MFKTYQQALTVSTLQRGMIKLTPLIEKIVADSEVQTGLCHIFIHHTSASLLINENADTNVQKDMETFFSRLIPEQASLYSHSEEGPDDMPSHIRTVLTESFLTIPITHSQLNLGTWQGIFLWEHRLQPHQRKLTITILGS
jgi:secondary thiamine-phosphate synthase enzyme